MEANYRRQARHDNGKIQIPGRMPGIGWNDARQKFFNSHFVLRTGSFAP
jgi:hypothetical protein